MLENKSLQLAFLISMLLHFIIFLSAPYGWVLTKKLPVEPIKVTYFKVKEQPKKVIGQKSLELRSRILPSLDQEAFKERL